MTAKPPERHDGPTPNGGAYSIAYHHANGSMEIVEFDAKDKVIAKTYSRLGTSPEHTNPRSHCPSLIRHAESTVRP